VKWERDLAVAEERSAYAQRRLSQIELERQEARDRAETVSGEAAVLQDDAGDIQEELDGVNAELQERTAAADEVRARLQAARKGLEEVEVRERDIARRGAQLEGDAAAADAQATELGRRIQRLEVELREAADALTDLAEQGDLFSGRMDELQRQLDAARGALEGATTEVEAARAVLDEARQGELETADRAQRLTAQRDALEEMARGREGMEPVIQELIQAGLPGVHGPLLDFVRAPADLAAAVEAYLGSQARGLVVDDAAAVGRVRAWFAEKWTRGGGLILLPLDTVPSASASGSLLEAVQATGAGAPWVRALLSGVSLVDDEALLQGSGPRLSRSGATREASGAVRIGNPNGTTGILERKERLAELVSRAESATAAAEQARSVREAARERLAAAEAAQEAARAAFRTAEDTFRKGAAEVAEATDRKARMDRHRDELARQLEGTRTNQVRAQERAAQAREDREGLNAEEAGLGDQRSRARAALETVQTEWEAARGEQSRLEVQQTRLSGELTRLNERLGSSSRHAPPLQARVESLDAEEVQLQKELEATAPSSGRRGPTATQQLFGQRDEAQADLSRRPGPGGRSPSPSPTPSGGRSWPARPSARRRTVGTGSSSSGRS
jgi:chromosome segregation ATPase